MNYRIYHRKKHKIQIYRLIYTLLPVIYFSVQAVFSIRFFLTNEVDIWNYVSFLFVLSFLFFFSYKLYTFLRYNRNELYKGEYIIVSANKIQFHQDSQLVKEIYEFEIEKILINAIQTKITIVEKDTNQKTYVRNIYDEKLSVVYDFMLETLTA